MKIHFFTAPFYFAFIWFKVLVAASSPQKEANPASLRSAAPSKGRGSRGYSLLPMEGGAPKGRRLDGGSGMKKSGKDRLKCVVYESPLSTAARSPFPNGEGKEEGASPPQKEANPASLRSAAPSKGRGSRGHSLPPPYGRRCPEGAEVGWGKRYEKEREDRLKCAVNESTRAPLRGPPSPMGKAAIRGCGFSCIVKANTGYVEKNNTPDTAFPSRGRWRAERAG